MHVHSLSVCRLVSFSSSSCSEYAFSINMHIIALWSPPCVSFVWSRFCEINAFNVWKTVAITLASVALGYAPSISVTVASLSYCQRLFGECYDRPFRCRSWPLDTVLFLIINLTMTQAGRLCYASDVSLRALKNQAQYSPSSHPPICYWPL